MVILKTVASGFRDGVQLMVREPTAEMAARGTKGVVKLLEV